MDLMPVLALGVFAAAGLGWFLWERSFAAADRQRTASESARTVEAHNREQIEAGREHLRTNAPDAITAFLHRAGVDRRRSRQAVETTQAALDRSQRRVREIIAEFPGNTAPTLARTILSCLITGFWVVAFVGGLLLNYPVFLNITGHDQANTMAMTLIVTCIMAAASAGMTLLHQKRPAEDGPAAGRWRRGASLGIMAGYCLALYMVVSLAPQRAEIDFAPKIQTVSEQIAQYREDGDTTGAAYQQATLDRLNQESRQAASTYQAMAAIAGGFEFLAGLAVPSTALILGLALSRWRERQAEERLREAKQAEVLANEAVVQEISAAVREANGRQDSIEPALASFNARTAAPPAPPATEPTPEFEAEAPPSPAENTDPSPEPDQGPPVQPVPGTVTPAPAQHGEPEQPDLDLFDQS